MTIANVIISTEVILAFIGILIGFGYIIRGWSISSRTIAGLVVLFGVTLIAAAVYSHVLVDAANRQNSVQKTISNLSDAVRLNPTATLYARRAEAFTAAGEGQKALRDVERAITIAPNNTEAQQLKERLINIAQPKYSIIDLGTLGGAKSLAYGINNLGHVTGFSDLTGPAAGTHAFLYDGQMHDLGALNDSPHNAPPSFSSGRKVNDSDQVVGNTYGATGGATAFMWDSAHGMQSLGFPNTYGQAINNKSQILVEAATIVPAQPLPAFLFDRTTGVEVIPSLANLQGCFPNVSALNDAGVVVGYCESSSGAPHVLQAFVWDKVNRTRALDAPGVIQSTAWSINNHGEITGSIALRLGVGRAVKWSRSGMQMLASIADGQGNMLNTDAYGINDVGSIVGMGSVLIDAKTVRQSAVLWIGSVGYLLDNLIPENSGWHLVETWAINNAGQIAGYGIINGQTHAFRLDPAPFQ